MITSESKRDLVEPWAEALAGFLEAQQSVRAVRLDPEHGKASFATLGKVDETALRRALEQVLLEIGEVAEVGGAPPGFVVRRNEEGIELARAACFTSPKLWVWRQAVMPETREEEHHEDWRPLAWMAGGCAVFGGAGFALETLDIGPPWLVLGLYVLALVSGGWDAAKDAWEDLSKLTLDIHFLMLLVAVGAASLGHWEEGALLLFLFSGAGALEAYALERTRTEVSALMKAAPKEAHLLEADGSERRIEIDAVKPGMRLRVRPGEAFPVDSVIEDGETAVDESSLTGEAVPVEKQPGDKVFSGTLNQWGSVDVRVEKAANESMLQRILRLVENARKLKAPSERFTERFGTRYTFLVLGICGTLFLYWWLVAGLPAFGGEETNSALYRAMTLLVVMSPCALVLSIPSAILTAIAAGAKRGILFRSGAAVEKLAGVNVVCLDKTGTLTTGELRVVAVESFPAGNEAEILEAAVAVEKRSQHPLARAIVAHGAHLKVNPAPAEGFRSITGAGAVARHQGREVALGKRELVTSGVLSKWGSALPEPPPSHTEVWVVMEDRVGRILLEDDIRKEARPSLLRLREHGVRTVMLTGDRRGAAESVAQELGISEVRAGLKPDEKVAAVRELGEGGGRVAMVGDGVNDAPSLAAAFVSVGMGARGSDAALEQSEIVLMHDRIENFERAHSLSLATRKVIRQNLVFSLAVVIGMAVITIVSDVHLSVGVIAHEGSTVLVCLNSLRLLWK